MTLLDFYSDWCGPCKRMHEVIDQIEKENPHIKVIRVNIDTELSYMEYNIRSIPTFILIEGNKEISRVAGAMSKEVLVSKLGI